ncbi:M48 family metalloprotease [Zavarzinia sp. CC-PAN008]|uniref:M48 family metalloprotease n=1 Tax=Zavarzinia sp. CC-PAN008 TaxID=3243332 RepID=UPI003F7492F5
MGGPFSAARAAGLSLIRDAETEHIIRELSRPIFSTAGLDPDFVRILLVRDSDINAFVAGGQNMFINTGTLLKVKRPAQLEGVIAHETGHISGGHLARGEEELRNASIQQIIATVLGAAAGMAAGGGSGVMSGISAGQQFAQRNFLTYRRTQESAADQAGASFLERIGVTGEGLVEFLSGLGDQEALSGRLQDPYVRTHPLSRDRVAALQERVEQSPYYKAEDAKWKVDALLRMQAKLYAFLEQPERALARFPDSDSSVPARYGRAVAYYRVPDLVRATAEVDSLLRDFPTDPYFWELKGQMLYENGRIAESIEPHRRSVELAPNEPLLTVNLAMSLAATGDPAALDEAIRILTAANRLDPTNPSAWYTLSSAYGQKNEIGLAAWAAAERYVLTGDLRGARIQALRAQQLLPVGSPGSLRAEDILAFAERRDER